MSTQKTKFVILGLLSIEPMSGYDIKKFIDTSINHFWSESNGQLYPALSQLVQENLIVLEEKQQKGKKVSNVYAITHEGHTTLEKWLELSTERKDSHRDEELLKLFFGKNTSPKVCIELLKTRAERVQKKIDEYLSIQKVLETHQKSPHCVYWNLCLKNGLYHAEAELRWCNESLENLSLP